MSAVSLPSHALLMRRTFEEGEEYVLAEWDCTPSLRSVCTTPAAVPLSPAPPRAYDAGVASPPVLPPPDVRYVRDLKGVLHAAVDVLGTFTGSSACATAAQFVWKPRPTTLSTPTDDAAHMGMSPMSGTEAVTALDGQAAPYTAAFLLFPAALLVVIFDGFLEPEDAQVACVSFLEMVNLLYAPALHAAAIHPHFGLTERAEERSRQASTAAPVSAGETMTSVATSAAVPSFPDSVWLAHACDTLLMMSSSIKSAAHSASDDHARRQSARIPRDALNSEAASTELALLTAAMADVLGSAAEAQLAAATSQAAATQAAGSSAHAQLTALQLHTVFPTMHSVGVFVTAPDDASSFWQPLAFAAAGMDAPLLPLLLRYVVDGDVRLPARVSRDNFAGHAIVEALVPCHLAFKLQAARANTSPAQVHAFAVRSAEAAQADADDGDEFIVLERQSAMATLVDAGDLVWDGSGAEAASASQGHCILPCTACICIVPAYGAACVALVGPGCGKVPPGVRASSPLLAAALRGVTPTLAATTLASMAQEVRACALQIVLRCNALPVTHGSA